MADTATHRNEMEIHIFTDVMTTLKTPSLMLLCSIRLNASGRFPKSSQVNKVRLAQSAGQPCPGVPSGASSLTDYSKSSSLPLISNQKTLTKGTPEPGISIHPPAARTQGLQKASKSAPPTP